MPPQVDNPLKNGSINMIRSAAKIYIIICFTFEQSEELEEAGAL